MNVEKVSANHPLLCQNTLPFATPPPRFLSMWRNHHMQALSCSRATLISSITQFDLLNREHSENINDTSHTVYFICISSQDNFSHGNTQVHFSNKPFLNKAAEVALSHEQTPSYDLSDDSNICPLTYCTDKINICIHPTFPLPGHSAHHLIPQWTVCTITFFINIWWRHTILFLSLTAVQSCIAHSGDRVEAKISLTSVPTVVTLAKLLVSVIFSLDQSIPSPLPKTSMFTWICSLKHRILQLIRKTEVSSLRFLFVPVHGVDTAGKSDPSCYNWSAILSAVG